MHKEHVEVHGGTRVRPLHVVRPTRPAGSRQESGGAVTGCTSPYVVTLSSLYRKSGHGEEKAHAQYHCYSSNGNGTADTRYGAVIQSLMHCRKKNSRKSVVIVITILLPVTKTLLLAFLRTRSSLPHLITSTQIQSGL